jgi:hypothetical protein
MRHPNLLELYGTAKSVGSWRAIPLLQSRAQDGDSESVLEIRKIEELQSIRAESLHKTKLDSLTSLYS